MRSESQNPERFTFKAFISYRHIQPDRKWAIWLHRALETYKPPKTLEQLGMKKRIQKIFRDEEELHTTPDLSDAIRTALKQSEYLIVVCSPRTAKSEWVTAEISYFRELSRGDYILPVLIEGSPNESFPQGLIGCIDGQRKEPLAADLRDGTRFLHVAPRRQALLRVAAPLLGCRFDDLRQRELERSRKRKRYLIFAIACALIAGSYLWHRTIQAEIAELTAYSRDSLNRDPSRSVLLSRLAFEKSSRVLDLGSDSDQKALEWAVIEDRLHAQFQMPGEPVRAVVWLPNGLISAGDFDGNLRVWNRVRGTIVFEHSIHSAVHGISFRPGEDKLEAAIATGGEQQIVAGATVIGDPRRELVIWKLPSNEIGQMTLSTNRVTRQRSDVSWCNDGHHVAASSGSTEILLWNNVDDYFSSQSVTSAWGYVNAISWNQNCTALAVGAGEGLYLWRADTNSATLLGRLPPDVLFRDQDEPEGVLAVDWSKDGKRILTGGQDRTIRIWPVDEPNNQELLSGHTDAVTAVAWSHVGTRIASVSKDGTLRIWDRGPYSGLYKAEVGVYTNQGSRCWGVAWSPDDNEVATVGDDGSVRVWNVSPAIEEVEVRGTRGVLKLDKDDRLTLNGRRLTDSELEELARQRSVRSFTIEECNQYFPRKTCPHLSSR